MKAKLRLKLCYRVFLTLLSAFVLTQVSLITPTKAHLIHENTSLYCCYMFRRLLRHLQGAVHQNVGHSGYSVIYFILVNLKFW